MTAELKTKYVVESKHGAIYTGGDIQFTDNGRQLLCRCDGRLNILDISTGTVAKTLGDLQTDVEDSISSFIASPDEELLLTAHRSLELRLWDLKTSTVKNKWKSLHKAPVSCCAFDTTSTLVATGSADATVKVWDVIGHYVTHNLKGHTGVISLVKFHPDPEKLWLITAGQEYSVRVWALESSECLSVLEGHNSTVTALCFSPELTLMYSAGRDSVITIWDLENLQKKSVLPVFEVLEGMVILPASTQLPVSNEAEKDDVHVITVGEKGVLKIWNVQKRKCVYQDRPVGSDEGCGPALVNILYSANTDTLATTTFDHNVLFYDLRSMAIKKQFVGKLDEVLDLSYLGANQEHVVIATNSPSLQVYDKESWNCSLVPGHTDTVLSLDVCPAEDMCVTGSKDNTIRIWRWNQDEESLVCVAVGDGHTHAVGTVAFSRTSSSFVVTGSMDQTLKVWHLSAANQKKADLDWSLKCELTEKAHDKDINSVAVSPNDKLIVSASQDKTAKLWRASDLTLLGVFRGHKRGIWSAEFSPIDQVVVTASADGTIRIWALSDFGCVKSLEGHDASVLRATFLARGMQLMSSGSDGLLKLWDLKSCECRATFDAHEDKLWALAVSKDESQLITGAADSTIAVWKDVTQTEKEEERTKLEEVILREQELENLLLQKKFLKALVLAIKLEQPFRALNILKEILQEDESTALLDDTLSKLKDLQLGSLLNYSATWNTNSRHCHVAQRVLNALLRSHTPESLLALPGAKDAVQGLLPYTHRHFQRMNRLQQQAAFVEYTWQTMKVYGKED